LYPWDGARVNKKTCPEQLHRLHKIHMATIAAVEHPPTSTITARAAALRNIRLYASWSLSMAKD
jgi:hypothetical protein